MNLKQFQSKYSLQGLELFNQDASTYKISFVANKLKQTESVHTSGQAIRLIKNKKIGFSANYGNKDLEGMIEQALKVSEFYPDVDLNFPFNLCKSEVANVNKDSNVLKDFEEKGKSIIETVLNDTSVLHATPLLDLSFEVSQIKERVENNNDLDYAYSKTLYSFSINIRDTAENDFIEIFTAVTENNSFDPESYLNELVRLYKLSKKQAKIKAGIWPILFTSKASKDLFSIVEMALSGKEVNQKSSPWYNKIDKQVLSNLITLKQDPSFGYMARSVDDEGNIVQPLTLVENGVLKNFYYDLLSAGRGDQLIAHTGNGFKPSLSSQPEPALLNMIVLSGNKSLDEIIKDIDYGLLVDQTIGGLTTNISGDTSVNIDVGFLIEKGEIVGRVKDTMVSGNIYQSLNKILEISNSPRWYWSNIYSPDILLDGFTVTSK